MKARELLYIDDDEDDQELFTMAVSEMNDQIKCISSLDACEALKKLENREWEPDIIFIDLNMPVMTGQQFLQEAGKINILDKIPVVVLSTSSNPVTIKTLKCMGARDFLTKPDSYSELIQILKPFVNA